MGLAMSAMDWISFRNGSGNDNVQHNRCLRNGFSPDEILGFLPMEVADGGFLAHATFWLAWRCGAGRLEENSDKYGVPARKSCGKRASQAPLNLLRRECESIPGSEGALAEERSPFAARFSCQVFLCYSATSFAVRVIETPVRAVETGQPVFAFCASV